MTIDMADIKDLIKDHMEVQPFTIRCWECHKDLDCDVEIDNDFDMKIAVFPCPNCTKQEE